MKVSVSNGQPVVQLQNAKVQIVPKIEIQLEGVWGFLFNWLVDWFEQTFTGYIEDAIETQMGDPVEKAVASVLAELAVAQTLPVPPLIPGATAVPLTIRTELSTVKFTKAGAVVGFSASAVTSKKTKHSALGSPGRAACLSGNPEPLQFLGFGAAEVAVHDDVLNELAFGLWWGDGLRFPVDASLLGQGADLNAYGITDLKMDVDFFLAPVLTSCNWAEQLQIQIGEVEVRATTKVFGLPSEVVMFVTVIAPAYMYASGDKIGFALDVPSTMLLDVAKVSGGLEGGADAIKSLVKDQVMPRVMDAVRDHAFVNFPIPSIDIGSIHPAFKGQKIAISVQQVTRLHGYTILSGSVM